MMSFRVLFFWVLFSGHNKIKHWMSPGFSILLKNAGSMVEKIYKKHWIYAGFFICFLPPPKKPKNAFFKKRVEICLREGECGESEEVVTEVPISCE